MQYFIHFVGTYPAPNAEAAMRDMLSLSGGKLYSMSDGETGDRQNWVVNLIDSYRTNPAFTLVKDGAWTSYTDCPEFAVAEGHTLSADDFALPYHQAAVEAWPHFERLREEYEQPELRFQIGMPHALDLALFTCGLERGMDPNVQAAAEAAILDQIARIRQEPFGDQVVIQLETPVSLSVALLPQDQLPPQLHPEGLAQHITGLVSKAPAGTQFGIHLCLGDLGHESRGHLETRDASVRLANEIGRLWPEGRTLVYVHEPVAAGTHPPSLQAADYEALQQLALPAATRYVAGFIHEGQTLEEQRTVLGFITDALSGRSEIGIATGCGMGRRPQEQARMLVERMTALASEQS